MPQSKAHAALELVATIARMKDEYEIRGGIASEDGLETVDRLIREARTITGIDPGYPRYCEQCQDRLQTDDSHLCEECK